VVRIGRISMRTLLVLAAIGAVLTAPAFAKRATNQQQSTYERNNNANPDFQLGGDRWKTNKRHRKHASSPSMKHKSGT
jgi:hypothetical protein